MLVLDAPIIPAQGFRGTIEFHCHPSQHRHNSHLFGFQIERRQTSSRSTGSAAVQTAIEIRCDTRSESNTTFVTGCQNASKQQIGPKHQPEASERVMGFEPTTSSLGS